jgi:hypothetical protein
MKNHYRFALLLNFILLSIVAVGCAPKQITLPEGLEPTCIQGTVSYRSPIDSTLVPYPTVKVTAHKHELDKPLTETTTDKAGNYCIEVPRGDFRVDLRIWGLVPLSGTQYLCRGSVDNIDLGSASQKCGEDCINFDIPTECKEFRPIRRR